MAVYGVFFYCLSDCIHDSPFAANLASLPRLPIKTSYAYSTSINISGRKLSSSSIFPYPLLEFFLLWLVLGSNLQTYRTLFPCLPWYSLLVSRTDSESYYMIPSELMHSGIRLSWFLHNIF